MKSISKEQINTNGNVFNDKKAFIIISNSKIMKKILNSIVNIRY